MACELPKLLGETQVVAGRQPRCTQRCVHYDKFRASRHQIGFAAITKHVNLAVDRLQSTVRTEEHAGVEEVAVVCLFGEGPAMQPCGVSLGDARHPRNEVAIQGLGMMSGACEVERSGIPQFRKHNEVRFTEYTVRFAQDTIDPIVDTLGVVTLDLDQCNPHSSVAHASTLLADGQVLVFEGTVFHLDRANAIYGTQPRPTLTP